MPTRWDAARAASQRTTRKYKPVAPIESVFMERGYSCQPVQHAVYGNAHGDYVSCRDCGYQVCDCDAKRMARRTLVGRMSILEGLQELGVLDAAAQTAAIKLLLTGES